MELHTSLAKMMYKYDVELMNTEVDWQRDSEMHLLWRKPQLMVRISDRAGNGAPAYCSTNG